MCNGSQALPNALTIFTIFAVLSSPISARATDYFLTIGGGYNPQGNQASLEANVLFFEQLLKDEHRTSRNTAVFFADGYDDQADLQVAVPATDAVAAGPLTDLLNKLHYRRGTVSVEYRNHGVTNIAGPISPKNIESNLRRSASMMKDDDRLIVYATAHDEPGKGKNKFDTGTLRVPSANWETQYSWLLWMSSGSGVGS